MSDKPVLKKLKTDLGETRVHVRTEQNVSPFIVPPAPKGLTLDEYQKFAARTANYPEVSMPVKVKGHNGDEQVVWIDMGVTYCTLGLAGEAGEVANVVKKGIRDGLSPAEQAERVKKELGDVLWYAAQLATELGMSLSEVAEANLSKLADRQTRGVIGGSGDDR